MKFRTFHGGCRNNRTGSLDGAKVVSSADLVQKYEAVWSPEQLESHLMPQTCGCIVAKAFQLAARGVRENRPQTEHGLKEGSSSNSQPLDS